jgi:hypothetical protein
VKEVRMFSWTDPESAVKPEAPPRPDVWAEDPAPANVSRYEGPTYGAPPAVLQPHAVTLDPAEDPLSVGADPSAWQPSATTGDIDVSYAENDPAPITVPQGGGPSVDTGAIIKAADDTAKTISTAATIGGTETPAPVSAYSKMRSGYKVFDWLRSLVTTGGDATSDKTVGAGVSSAVKLALAGTPAGAAVSLGTAAVDQGIKLAGGEGSVDEAIGSGVKTLSRAPRAWGRGAAEHPDSAESPIVAEQHGWAPEEALEEPAAPSAPSAPTSQVLLPPAADPLAVAPPQDAWASGWAG